MNTTDRRRGVVALSWLFGAAAILAACGGSGGDAGAPPPVAGAPAPAPGPAPGPAPAPAPGPAPAPSPAPAPTPTPTPIAQTPAGEPQGLPTFATIGAAGGSMASSDGRLMIDVPAAALAADTEIGIQPIAPTAPGALGSAYRLTADGMAFAQPVTLNFRYSADEGSANVIDAMQIATRDAQGRWALPAATHDPAQRTLAVTTSHFSDWSLVGGAQLAPASATVAVRKNVALRVVRCGRAEEVTPPVMRECRNDFDSELEAITWSVNAIANGNATVGTVSGTSPAAYTAPAAVPAQNPVAVSGQVSGLPTPGQQTLVSNITIVDGIGAYAGTFSSRVNTPNGQSQLDANVRFTLSSVNDDGIRTYLGTGTARLGGTLTSGGITCTWVPKNGDLLPVSTLIVMPPDGVGALSDRYQISVAAQAMSTLHCPESDSPGPLQVSHAVGADSPCELPRVGNEPSLLAGAWGCNLPVPGGTLQATWRLKAE